MCPPYLWFLAMFKQGCDIVISTMKEKQLKSTRRLHRPRAVTFTRQPLLSPSSATGMNRLALVVYTCALTPAPPENTVKTEESHNTIMYLPGYPTHEATLRNAWRKRQRILHHALRGNRTPGGSMATTQVTTTPLMPVF